MNTIPCKSTVAALWLGMALSFALLTPTILTADSVHQNLALQRHSLANLKTKEGALSQQMQTLQRELLEKATEIQKWKESQGNALNPFIQYRLHSLMQSAHDLATRMERLERKKQAVSKKIQSTSAALAQTIDDEMERVAAALTGSHSGTAKQRGLSKQLQRLNQERNQLNVEEHPAGLTMNQNAVPTEKDSLDDLREKAAFLYDLKDKIQKNMEAVGQRLVAAKRQQLVFEEARHLLDEEAFFSETSFAKNEPARQDNNSKELESGGALDAKTREDQESKAPHENDLTNNQNQDPNGGVGQGDQESEDNEVADVPTELPEASLTEPTEPEVRPDSPLTESPTLENTLGRNTVGLEDTDRLDIERVGSKPGLTMPFHGNVRELELAQTKLHRQLKETSGNLKKILALIQILEGVEKTSASNP